MPVHLLSRQPFFPPPAASEPDGLLAVGGDLSVTRLVEAYRHGIFPWYSEGDPILWWSPDPRLVLFPDEIRVSRRLERTIRSGGFTITVDRAFEDVIRSCAALHAERAGATWITADMIDAYIALHRAGYGRSVECWQDGALAGGIYGVVLGRVFFGESMFSAVRDASKIAVATLARSGAFSLIDCQVPSEHMQRLGARPIPRKRFLALIERFSG